MDFELLNSLVTLLIFVIVCYANAQWIIAFHKWCEYDVHETDKNIVIGNNVIVLKAGEIVEESKMILWRFKRWVDARVTPYWRKPIYACPTCQASLHGIPVYLVAGYVTGLFNTHWALSILYGLFYIGALSGKATELNEK